MTDCPKLAVPLSQVLIRGNETCEELTLFSNITKVRPGDKVTFTCNEACSQSYTQRTIVCRQNGTWYPPPPFCKDPPKIVEIIDNLTREDIIIIAGTVGSVAALIFIVILILLLWQKIYPRDTSNDERTRIISQYGTPSGSFHSRDYQPPTAHVYGNAGMMREHEPAGLSRSRSLRESRDMEPAHYSRQYQSNIRRSESLQEYDGRERDMLRNQKDMMYMNVFTDGIKRYHVPRPAVGDRFEPLWTGATHM